MSPDTRKLLGDIKAWFDERNISSTVVDDLRARLAATLGGGIDNPDAVIALRAFRNTAAYERENFSKITEIKFIRERFHMGLREAKDFVERYP